MNRLIELHTNFQQKVDDLMEKYMDILSHPVVIGFSAGLTGLLGICAVSTLL